MIAKNIKPKSLFGRLAFLFIPLFILFSFSGASAQTATKLQILLPGMTAAPGTQTGYTGEPLSQSVGVPFNITVNAVDANWNVVSVSDQVSISSSDPYATLPLPTNLTNGTVTLTVTLNSSGVHAISAYDDSNPSVQGVTSPTIGVSNISTFTITDIGDPWWTLPGQVTVGDNIRQVEIIAVDENGERASNFSGYVSLTEQTDYGIGRVVPDQVRLEAGKWKGTIQIFRAGKKTRSWGVTGDVWIRVSNNSIIGESNRFCALPRQLNRLLTVVPGENFLPGSLTGRTGSPSDQQSGSAFSLDVYATDQYWNQISDVSHRISLSSSDPDADLPQNSSMTNGKVTMPVTLNSSGSRTITATDISNYNIQSHTSSAIQVIAHELHHFVINQISTPQRAGEAFPVTITAVDDQDNIVNDYSAALDLAITTGAETLTPDEIFMSNGLWSGNVLLTKAASLVILSVQDRTSPPHAGTSNQFDVQAGPAAKLQVLLPGETSTPGISPGKIGAMSDILAGTSFIARVNSVDAWWNVISSSSDVVHLSSSDPIASLPAESPLSMGTRQFSVTLNTPGLQTITGSDITNPGISSGTSSQIRVNPGNLDHFKIELITGIKIVGSPFPVTINAVDNLGNMVTSFYGHVALSASTGDGTIIPVDANFSNGTWTGAVTVKKASESVTITATDGATPSHSGTSNEFVVNPGPLAKMQVLVPGLTATPGLSPGYSGSAQSQNVGQPFSITINGVDAYWNVVVSANDSFAVSSTDVSASLPEATRLYNGSRNLSITLNEDGEHTVSAFHLNNQGVQNGQSPLITVLPQNLDHFSFDEISGPAVVGQPMQVTIRAENVNNERVYNFEGSLNLSASTGAGTAEPNIVGPFVDGEWSGEIILKRAATEVRLNVSDGATPAHIGSSNAFTVSPGSFAKLQVLLDGETAQPGSASGKSGVPVDQQTGTQFAVTIRAVDSYWNLISGVSDSVKILTSDSLALFTNKAKLINGIATPTIITGSAGTHTVTAMDISNPAILSGISSGFNVNPGNIDHFIFAAISAQIAGEEFTVSITAADAAGNAVSGFNGRARLQSSTGAGTFTPNEITFVDGSWSGKMTLTRAAQNIKLTCLDFAATPHTGESNSFDLSPCDFTKIQILLPGQTGTPGIAPGKTGEPDAQIAGDALVVTVNAVDDWWNPVPTATGTIGLTSTDASANLPLDAALQSGSANFTDMRFATPGYWTVTAHCRSNPAISSDTSPLVHVITGGVASFVFDPINSPQAAGDTIHISVRAVDGSGQAVSTYNEMASLTASTGPGTIFADEVQFENGTWSGSIILTKATQSVHLNIHDFADIVRGNSNPFTLLPGEFARLQILLPGEEGTPGLEDGKQGTPIAQSLGVPFSVKVNATDSWWNPVAPDSLVLRFSSSDAMASLPGDTLQNVQSREYSLTLLTEGNKTISVEALNISGLTDTSTPVYIQSGQLDHFVFSMIEDDRVAGKMFTVKVEAFNQYDYPVTDYEGDIILSASTGNGTLSNTGVTLSNGFWQGELFVTRADSEVVIYAADYVPSPNTHTGYSNSFAVHADSLAGLQVLLPGESANPGVSPGKKGAAISSEAGSPVNVLVRAVDEYWNLIPNLNDTISVCVSDSFAVLPEFVEFEQGIANVSVTFREAKKHVVTANYSSLPRAKSDSLKVGHSNYSQLLLVLPGEEILPGDIEQDPLHTPGRKGMPLAQTSGLPFDVRVVAVDDYWNPVGGAPADRIHLYTTDSNAQFLPADTTLENGVALFSVTLMQGGNQVLRAINDSNINIRASLDAILEMLVGGLHYEVALETSKIAAGEEFGMTVFYKNGIGEVVVNANQIVRLTAVKATDLDSTVGELTNNSFNLQNGQRTVSQLCNVLGTIRIKVEDDLGTDPAYSDPLEIFAGSVASIVLSADKAEVRALEQTNIIATLTDAAGNKVGNQEVAFSLLSGTGELKQNSAMSNAEGIVSVPFVGGRISESNFIQAQVNDLIAEFEVVVNLTPTSLENGVPVNYPNPFGIESPVTHIEYYLAEDADVTLKIYDLFGNPVWTKEIEAGTPGGIGRIASKHANSIEWDGFNDNGQKVGNGGYILIAKAVANGKVIMNNKRKIAVVH